MFQLKVMLNYISGHSIILLHQLNRSKTKGFSFHRGFDFLFSGSYAKEGGSSFNSWSHTSGAWGKGEGTEIAF